MGLGCFAVPIVIILVLAVAGFAIAAIFQGIAAASVSIALLAQTLLLPVLILTGIVGGIGIALGAPAVVRIYANVKGLRVSDSEFQIPAQRAVSLPGPRVRGCIVRRSRRRAIRVDLDRGL